MPSKASSTSELSAQAINCRLDRHVWGPSESVPLTITRDSAGREASRRRVCLAGCGVIKTEFFEVDIQSRRLPLIKTVMDYSKADDYCMEKGYGRVDRATLRFEKEYSQLEETPKKTVRAKSKTQAKTKPAKAIRTPRAKVAA